MIDARTKFEQSTYFLKNMCMNDIRPVSVKISIAPEWGFVNTNGSFFQIRIYRAVRGNKVGFGPTPAHARRRLREKERIGR